MLKRRGIHTALDLEEKLLHSMEGGTKK
jgi:hypothetical protein